MPVSRKSRGGAHERKPYASRARTDRDGDLLMGGAPTQPRPRPGTQKQQASTSSSLIKNIELAVTGWQTNEADKTISNLLSFLQKHALKRNNKARAEGRMNLIMIHRIEGDTLYIKIREDDANSFLKVNNFKWIGEKLTIRRAGRSTPEQRKSPSKDNDELSPEGSAIRQLLQNVLNRRYNAETKLLDLSALATDPELQSIGMFNDNATESKFFPALMLVCNKQFKTRQEKQDTVQSVSVARNALPNVQAITSLAQTFPDLLNLDLSGNAFQSTKDLAAWRGRFRNLNLLVLEGNPALQAQADWEKTITKWFPRLRILNGTQVRSDADIARIDAPKQTPVPSTTPVWHDLDGVGERFLLEFFPGFDNDREATVRKFFTAISTFSMSISTSRKDAPRGTRFPSFDAYIHNSRNLTRIERPAARNARKHDGLDAIIKAWAALPATRHPALPAQTHLYQFDCLPISKVPDPTGRFPAGVCGLMLTVHGEYEEHYTVRGRDEIVRRSFDRTFILGPGASEVPSVISDVLMVHPHDGVTRAPVNPATNKTPNVQETAIQSPAVNPINAVNPAPAVNQMNPVNSAPAVNQMNVAPAFSPTPEQTQMMLQVHQATGMNEEYCAKCLDAAGWDMVAAAQLFETQKANIPAEAFVL